VIAIGYPRLTDVLNMGFALHPTVVPGNINGLVEGRSRLQQRFASFLQITGLINQGSSGGPLVDATSGEVTGMVVLQVPYLERARDRNGTRIGSVMIRAGIGYAIPVFTISRWLADNGLAAEGQPVSSSPGNALELAPSAERSFATGHVIYAIAQVLPKDPDLYNLAIYHFEAAVKLQPQESSFLRHLGIAYAASGRFDDAIQVMREALGHEPGSALLAYELGLAQEAKGLRNDALNTWEQFLGRPPASSPDSWRDKMHEAVDRLRAMTASPKVLTAIPVKDR
jgi:hypothetical protein